MSAPLIAALGKLAVPKTATALMSFAGDMKKTAEDGQLAQTFKSLSEFGVSMEPLMAPLQLITAQINVGTIESVMKLSQTLMDLIANPAVEYIISLFIRALNNILAGVDRFGGVLDKVMDFFAQLSEQDGTVGKVMGYLGTILTYVVDFATYGEKFQDFLAYIMPILKDKLEPMFEPTKEFLVQIGEFITNTFEKFMGWMKDDVIPWFKSDVEPVLTIVFDGIKKVVDYIWDFLEPILSWFLEQLGKLEAAFQKLTGIDVGAWVESIFNTMKGWFE